jgi:D-mannonate dehydratase
VAGRRRIEPVGWPSQFFFQRNVTTEMSEEFIEDRHHEDADDMYEAEVMSRFKNRNRPNIAESHVKSKVGFHYFFFDFSTA